MTRWLVAECAMSEAQALRQSRTAKRLAVLPAVTSAFETGELSAGQIELVASWVKPRHVALFGEHESAMVPALARLDIDATVTVLRDWTTRADAILDGAEPDDRTKRSTAHLNRVLDDYGRLDANLTTDDYAIVVEAIRLARRADDPDTDGPKRTRAERDGDALVDLCRRMLRDDNTPRTAPGRQRPGVNLVIEAADFAANTLRALGIGTVDQLETYLTERATSAAERAWYQAGLTRRHQPGGGSATTLSGDDISPALAAAFCCDATLRRVVANGSEIIDYGRAMPTLPQSVSDAVVVHDRQCRFRGCDRTVDWCEVHHVRRRTDGGPDAVSNCVLLCARHHHVLHRDGWTAHSLPTAPSPSPAPAAAPGAPDHQGPATGPPRHRTPSPTAPDRGWRSAARPAVGTVPT